jgi:leucyl-tRNA synthetase
LHGILVISDALDRARQCRAPTIQQNHISKTEGFGKPVSGSIPTVIRSYKSAVTKRINLICNTKYTSLIWQHDLYEHVSRDEESLQSIRQYITENPQRWAEDPENPQHYSETQVLLLELPF